MNTETLTKSNTRNQIINQENKKRPKNWIFTALLIVLIISLGINGLFAYQNNQFQKRNKISSSNVADLEQTINELETNVNLAKPYNPIDNRFSGLLAKEPKTTGGYNLWVGETQIGRGYGFGATDEDKNIFEEMEKNNQDFCAVKVYVKNQGDKILIISSNNFSMTGKDGLQAEWVANATTPLFPDEKVELYPGYEIQGYLTFKVKTLPELLELKFQPDDLSLEPVILEVYDSSKIPEAGQ